MDGVLALLFLIAIYFTPSFVAFSRRKEVLAIFLLNLLLGWTLIGWVAALVWAATGQSPKLKIDEVGPQEPKPMQDTPATVEAPAPKEASKKATPALEPQFRRISGRAFKRASGLGLSAGTDGDEGKPHNDTGTTTEPALAHITYIDATGTKSERLVTLRRINNNREEQRLLQAFCHMRSELRSFRVDRIDSLVDVQTGEVIEGSQAIEKWLGLRTPTDLGPALDGLTVLSFIAAADDHISDEEIAIMARFASQVAPGVRIPADFAQRLSRFAPDPEAVKAALTAIEKTNHASAFANALQEIVDSDNHLHPAEVQAIVFLQIKIEID